jgi:hypothetical protein
MKVDGSLKSLIQGVSQQPPRTRLPGQCTLQENMSSNPVDGLSRRPPVEVIGDLFEESDPVQFYDLRLGSENYVVCALEGNLRVFTLDGEEKTVNETDDAFDYLDGGKLVFTNLENDTYIANTTVQCEMESELPSFIDYGPIVYIRGGNYGTTYTITVNWKDAGPGGTPRTISVSHTTSTTDVTTIQTKAIATALKVLLDAVATNSFNTTFDVFQKEDVLYIQWKPATLRTDMFTAVASDTAGNNNCIACNNDVKLVSQLPRFAPHGYFVRVSGDGSADQDDYYLEFSVTPDDQGVTPALGAGFGSAGIWIETVKNKIPYLIDWDTMPHILSYDEDTDEFTFGPGEWADRAVGDEDSNPDPSFIGRTVNDLSYFQGRLTLLAGPAVVMSRTNKPLDFWSESATTVADTDPIDIQSTAQGVTQMLKAIPNNRDLVVFADNAQFVVLGRNTITPNNSSLVLTTSFEANLDASPVPAGRNIFFAINYGPYTGIREFYTADSVDINDSRPITQHVLKYIPGGVKRLASSSNFDNLLVQAGDLKNLYVYEYIWVDDRKAQSSWSTWIMPNDVSYFFFVESVVHIVSRIGNNYVLEKMDLNTQFDEEMAYQVKLDRKVYIEDVETTVVDPIPHETDIDDMVFVQGVGCPYPGMRAMVKTYDEGTNTVEFTTDMEGGTVIAGVRYLSRYRPTMPFVKDQDGVKVGTGRLVIGKFFINCRETGSMEARIVSKYRADSVLHYSGRVVGNPNSVVGVPAITDEVFTIPYRDNIDNGEIELFTDSHLPLTVMDIEWIGQYTKRGQRITQGE